MLYFQKVYDLTPFLSDHPGGARIIVKYAGKDATAAFDGAGHPRDIVTQLGLDHLCLGDVAGQGAAAAGAESSRAAMAAYEASVACNPPLDHVVNLFDFEAVAQQCMQKQAVRGRANLSMQPHSRTPARPHSRTLPPLLSRHSSTPAHRHPFAQKCM